MVPAAARGNPRSTRRTFCRRPRHLNLPCLEDRCYLHRTHRIDLVARTARFLSLPLLRTMIMTPSRGRAWTAVAAPTTIPACAASSLLPQVHVAVGHTARHGPNLYICQHGIFRIRPLCRLRCLRSKHSTKDTDTIPVARRCVQIPVNAVVSCCSRC